MTNPAHPGRMLFVNIPVANLERSKAFFAKLGFSYNPMFTDETAACMLVGEHGAPSTRRGRPGARGPVTASSDAVRRVGRSSGVAPTRSREANQVR